MWLLPHSRTVGHDESRVALADAQENLVRARARTPEVITVAQALRTLREHNHFAEKLSFIATRGGNQL